MQCILSYHFFVNTWYIINIYYINSLYRLLSWQHWWPEITFFSTAQVIHAKITNMSHFADACLGKRDLPPIYALLHFSLPQQTMILASGFGCASKDSNCYFCHGGPCSLDVHGILGCSVVETRDENVKIQTTQLHCESCVDLAFWFLRGYMKVLENVSAKAVIQMSVIN